MSSLHTSCFLQTVTPNGTAKEVFQNEVVPAFPRLDAIVVFAEGAG